MPDTWTSMATPPAYDAIVDLAVADEDGFPDETTVSYRGPFRDRPRQHDWRWWRLVS